MKNHMKMALAAAVVSGAAAVALAESGHETVVAESEAREFWMAGETVELARAASPLWLGPDEIVMDRDGKRLAYMPVSSWSVGADAYAYLDGTGVLTVFGEGAAAALPAGVDRLAIKGVVVDEDVTSIGASFFKKSYNINSFTGGEDLVSFGEKAFYLCSSLERIEIDNPSFNLEASGLQDAVVYQAAIRPDGTLYTIPAISLPGYKAVLYGTNDLTDPSGWRRVDPSQTMEESGYHFFKYVLEKQGK